MAESSARESKGSPRPRAGGSGHNERFVILVEGDRALILASYERKLAESESPLIGDARSREQVLVNGGEILADVTESVRANTVRIDDGYKRIAWEIGEARAISELSPADSLRAAVIFFNVTVDVLARHAREDPDLVPSFAMAIVTLNESINRRIREASLAYTGHLLDRIHRAHLDERHRIARELHDQLGEGMSGAMRQLELHELTEPDQSVEPALHTSLAMAALIRGMDGLRLVLSDLRRDLVTSLEKALADYIASAGAEADVRLRVNGTESWAPPMVIDEAFMIIREALRNALTHAAPRLVLIGVDLAPDELRAWVEDDGRGFEPRNYDTRGRAGLDTMRERAALIGGTLTMSSSPGQGTQVELIVPLPGLQDG